MINTFIHPNLRNPEHKDYKKVRIYTWAMLVIGLFLIPYCIYFLIKYPNDNLKNLTNLVFTGVFVFGVLLGRYSNNIKASAIFVAVISYPPIMISVYNTGGIYSVDHIWFFVCIVSQCIFIDYRIGICASIAVFFFYTYLYIIEYSITFEGNFFKQYILEHNSTHNYFSLVFVTFLVVSLLSTFSKTLAVTNKKLDELSKEKIYMLENILHEKTKELSQIRQTLAKDFHDEMGNKLASISLLSQSASLKLNNSDNQKEAIQLLTTIETRSKELYEGTKDFIWSIDLKSDYTDELFVYLRDFGEIFFEPMQISFHSEYKNVRTISTRLPATYGRQLVYICKEIMTNSAKHSGCSEVIFSMIVTEQFLEVELKDNGNGFVKEHSNQRGLRNIDQRIKAVFGNYKVTSNNTEGTHYSITVRLEENILSV